MFASQIWREKDLDKIKQFVKILSDWNKCDKPKFLISGFNTIEDPRMVQCSGTGTLLIFSNTLSFNLTITVDTM